MLIRRIANFLRKLVDIFYFGPFKLIPLVTFRYAVVGGANVLFGIVNYWFIFNFILFQKDVDLCFMVISAPIVAFVINFIVTFFTGFWLMKNVAFTQSRISSFKQLFRYSVVVFTNILVNYFGLKFLTSAGVYPSIANALIQPFTILISYLLNSRYTFR